MPGGTRYCAYINTSSLLSRMRSHHRAPCHKYRRIRLSLDTRSASLRIRTASSDPLAKVYLMANPTTYISDCDPLLHSTPSRSTSGLLASPSTAPYFAPISPSDSESSLRPPYANYLSHNRSPSMSSNVNMGWDGRVTHPRQGSMAQKVHFRCSSLLTV
ncbi:hypothetical protein PENSPDRAFT_340700 [Peniophora sp. CONT]|nr:hypothetical protein PENSPDRAFT_340700 [Peniophora sp. CONT]